PASRLGCRKQATNNPPFRVAHVARVSHRRILARLSGLPKHPLMLAALPKIKEEVEARRLGGDTYALLYDRIQLLLGKKQHYGTRMGKDPTGQPIVLPTELPETVDERRKSLGMDPLSVYVKIFGASAARFSSACH
ncbi:MAG: hypothetical protein ABIS20_22935, partial [Thermoanaerobaculia bacterium]